MSQEAHRSPPGVLCPSADVKPMSNNLVLKANRSEPKSCLCRVFIFELGCFVMSAKAGPIQAGPISELKTRPRFRPVSLSLSMSSALNVLAVHVCSLFVYTAMTILCEDLSSFQSLRNLDLKIGIKSLLRCLILKSRELDI
jgi:hypothetical protein